MGASPEGNGGKTGKLPAWGPTHEDRNGQPCLTNLAVYLKNTCMLTLILFVTTILKGEREDPSKFIIFSYHMARVVPKA